MKKQKAKPEKITKHEIWLESFYTGKTHRPIYFIGSEKDAVALCKRAYNFYKSCKLNGVEQNKQEEQMKKEIEFLGLIKKEPR